MSVRIFVFLLFCFVLQNSKVHASSATCYYEESDYHGYSCTLGITDSQDTSSFTEINGDHLEGRSDDDVAGVWVYREVRTPDLPAFVCKRFKNLKNFFFQQLVLRELPEDAFVDCKNILDITIQSKKYADAHMTKLPPNLLAGNPKLKIFEAELQELRTLPENFFANNPNLHKIALNTNRIRSLPANIFKPLINLEELSLSRNSLSKINPSWFETLTNLERLYLNDNQISDIPKNAFASLKNLNDLWISSNSIKVIHSDSFSQHPHLASINLVYNRINAIDEKFIDNIGIRSFQFTNMACAENQFVPESEDKTKLKEVLKTCFENYQPREESATADDVEERFEVDEPTTPEPSGSPFDNVDGEKLLQEFLLIFGALKKQLEEAAKNETEN